MVYKWSELIVIALVGTILAVAVVVGVSLVKDVREQHDAINDFKDEMVAQRDLGYEYSVSNVDLSISLELELRIESDGEVQVSELVTFDIICQCELYSISCLLNDDGDYDLTIDIVGLYLNVTVTTVDGISGGTLTIDEFHYDGVVDDCTDETIRETLLKVADLEQWEMEA
jgi:hypothetical protein